jgi:hypothetical protein
LFSNVGRRIVPVPYVTPYGPCTILDAGFVPYVRHTYKLVLPCVRYIWFCDPSVLAAALTHSLLLYLHYQVLSTLLDSRAVRPQEKSHQVSVGYRLQVPCPKGLTPLSSKHMQFQNNNNNNNNNCKRSSLATSLGMRVAPYLFSSACQLLDTCRSVALQGTRSLAKNILCDIASVVFFHESAN